MNNLRQAAEMALEALTKEAQLYESEDGPPDSIENAIDALRQALAERHECETCANKRQRLIEAGFLKSPLRRGV